MQIVDEIGKLKKEHNVAVLQNNRWVNMLDRIVEEGASKGLSEDFIISLFKAIHQESINHQENIVNN